MNSRQINSTVHSLVDWYAEHDRHNILQLNVSDIPESDLNVLVSYMISQDDDLAAEATGPDNPEFYTTILPAMLRSLNMPKNGFENEEFHDVYKSSIRNYLTPRICRMIDDRLDELNGERECQMELVWDRAGERTIEVRSRL